MADEMKPTPRGFISGLFSDVLGRTLNMPSLPRTGVPSLDLLYANRNPLFNLMGVGDVQKTAERISYGEPLTTGSGMTTKPREETLFAGMAVAPLAPVAGKVGKTVGRMAGAEINAAMTGQPTRSLLGQITPKPKLLDVYHGTPHTLPPTEHNPLGEFDASKIGTGEGAQAYGYGIYTAELPDVARTYQNRLSKYGELRFADGTVKNVQDLPYGSPEQIAGQIWINKPNLADAKFALSNLDSKYLGASKEDVLKQLESLDAGKAKLSGNLYKVDLPDEKIATMLNWDKPLSQQPAQVKKALKGIEQDLPSIPDFDLKKWMDADPLASTWHNVLVRDLKVEPSKIAELLQSQGVAGIRYLDEGSRATTGKQTSNFVVFPNEEKSMTILERNGVRAFPQEVSYPQQAALDLAQQRAALPVSEGGLGLPANNTAMDRARAMGFGTEAYHGTNANVPVFDISKNITAKDIYSSPNPSEASAYATREGGNVMPLLLRGDVKDLTKESQYVDNQLRKAYNAQVSKYERQYYPFEQFKESFMRGQLYQDTGGQSAQNALVGELIGNRKSILKIPDAVSDFGVGESYVMQNPANIRSRFAAFDPFRKDVATATAMGVALPDLLAQPVDQYQQTYETTPMYTDPFGNTIGSSIR